MKKLLLILFISLGIVGCSETLPNLLELDELEGFVTEADPVDRDDF